MFILTLAAAVAMAAATPAAGAAPVAPEGAAQAAPAAKPENSDKQICKTEPLVGSRVPKKVCATKAEWEARRQNDKEQLDKMQRASTPHNGM